jgi:hypothetical protein
VGGGCIEGAGLFPQERLSGGDGFATADDGRAPGHDLSIGGVFLADDVHLGGIRSFDLGNFDFSNEDFFIGGLLPVFEAKGGGGGFILGFPNEGKILAAAGLAFCGGDGAPIEVTAFEGDHAIDGAVIFGVIIGQVEFFDLGDFGFGAQERGSGAGDDEGGDQKSANNVLHGN